MGSISSVCLKGTRYLSYVYVRPRADVTFPPACKVLSGTSELTPASGAYGRVPADTEAISDLLGRCI